MIVIAVSGSCSRDEAYRVSKKFFTLSKSELPR